MQCEIYDLSGRLISSYTTFEPSMQLNTRTLSAGIYILKVIKGNRMAASRIIIE
ncbi:MAG: T9SS type A sorting domain-containing protein [Bacteroidetes bacterium]|nr:T9SS type A sorting domain-containing protein [Bacteroidota bacterium]